MSKAINYYKIGNDPFIRHVDLTDDCGATVRVPSWSREDVCLGMGGDLSISIRMGADAARALGEALIAAATATTPKGAR